jgi:hypothetical protein
MRATIAAPNLEGTRKVFGGLGFVTWLSVNRFRGRYVRDSSQNQSKTYLARVYVLYQHLRRTEHPRSVNVEIDRTILILGDQCEVTFETAGEDFVTLSFKYQF